MGFDITDSATPPRLEALHPQAGSVAQAAQNHHCSPGHGPIVISLAADHLATVFWATILQSLLHVVSMRSLQQQTASVGWDGRLMLDSLVARILAMVPTHCEAHYTPFPQLLPHLRRLLSCHLDNLSCRDRSSPQVCLLRAGPYATGPIRESRHSWRTNTNKWILSSRAKEKRRSGRGKPMPGYDFLLI